MQLKTQSGLFFFLLQSPFIKKKLSKLVCLQRKCGLHLAAYMKAKLEKRIMKSSWRFRQFQDASMLEDISRLVLF